MACKGQAKVTAAAGSVLALGDEVPVHRRDLDHELTVDLDLAREA